jgi:hypothetical protein
MSSEAFKELAKPLLSKKDAALLDLVSLDPLPPVKANGDNEDKNPTEDKAAPYTEKAAHSGSSFIDRWREWERVLRLNLAKYRAAKLGRPVPEAPVVPVEAAIAAEKAVGAAVSPLEVEIQLDKARWNAIEVLQGNFYFDRNTIFAYLLKLLILERRVSFQVEQGFSEYKSLYTSIMEIWEKNKESTLSGLLPAGESI